MALAQPCAAALASGERREGWRAHLRLDDREPHVVSVSAAPFPRDQFAGCDTRVAFVVVVRPADEDQDARFGGPTAIDGLIARSSAMMRILTLIDNLSHSDATVLITGESGTGKEVVARAIHDRSPRRKGAFVAVNCGALPADLLESEMFGHVRGAFTGAVRDRVGRFDLASRPSSTPATWTPRDTSSGPSTNARSPTTCWCRFRRTGARRSSTNQV